jgi:hypothetical protein
MKKTDPPKLALWWLQHGCPGPRSEALTGDLIECLREGQTQGWFWRQVSIAFVVSLLGDIRRHWPHFCYAIAGTAMPLCFRDAPALRSVPDWLHWTDLAWPWSQLVLELSRTALLALAALSILAVGLMIHRSFRPIFLLRTAMINLALITLGHFSTDFLPWLSRPVLGDPHRRFLIIPGIAQMVLFFGTFLVASWVGTRSAPSRSEPRPQRTA